MFWEGKSGHIDDLFGFVKINVDVLAIGMILGFFLSVYFLEKVDLIFVLLADFVITEDELDSKDSEI